MPLSNTALAKPSPTASVDARANEIEMSMFSLRDTLSSITVRDANFGEFLAALKKCGVKVVKPS